MKAQVVTSIFIGLTMLAACQPEEPPPPPPTQATITSDSVNGVNGQAAINAVFGSVAAQGLDFDGDGVNDFDVSAVIVIASDLSSDELCTLLSDPANNDDDPNNDVLPDDFVQAFAVASRIDAAGQGVAFAAGDVVVGDPNAQAFPFFAVDGGFTVRQGGVDIANTTGEGNGTFTLTTLEGNLFAGSLTSVMTLDSSSGQDVPLPAPVALTAEFQDVQGCAALNGL
jgi:hypothetical protein